MNLKHDGLFHPDLYILFMSPFKLCDTRRQRQNETCRICARRRSPGRVHTIQKRKRPPLLTSTERSGGRCSSGQTARRSTPNSVRTAKDTNEPSKHVTRSVRGGCTIERMHATYSSMVLSLIMLSASHERKAQPQRICTHVHFEDSASTAPSQLHGVSSHP